MLGNTTLTARWELNNGRLTGPSVKNAATGEELERGEDLFAIALEPQQVDADWVYLGLSLTDQQVTAQVSLDGRNWNQVGQATLPEGFRPALLRVGKTDTKGGSNDYPDAGAVGTSEFLEVLAKDPDGKVSVLTGKPARIHQSSLDGTRLEIHNERGAITVAANAAAFAEYELRPDTRFVSCRIRKGDDQGMSWGPGLSLRAGDDSFVTLNVRGKETFNLISSDGEKIIPFKANAGLNCGLSAAEFTCVSVQLLSEKDRKLLRAKLVHPKNGLQVAWQAELCDGSNYIRQEFVISGTKPLEIHGLRLLELKAGGARQIGEVAGSPVATDSFFTGVEMPVTADFLDAGGFQSGFACYLPVDSATRYSFGTVGGTFPQGQLRRAFQYYLERERATPSSQFLHYNNWYDFRPSETAFLKVIDAYKEALAKPHGITMDSFVMDDGWDNYNEGLWAFDQTHFPNGFSKVASSARKAGSGVDPHFMALLRIASDLKAAKPDLYLNVTVGTWPSPFWLNHIDCTWRDGSGDVAWHGPGDKRESWLTYRDMHCCRLCVRRAPLYPINSLMHHGLVIGHHYQGKDVATAGADFKNDARSYFGLGPNLQELYLSPDLMDAAAWGQIAEAVHWSKANQEVLVDAHWVGGDPGNLEVYGCAAWRADKGTLMLRNPSDEVRAISLDVAQAFELPAKAATRWKLANAYKDQKYDAPEMTAGKQVSFTLQPLQVLVFDARAF